MSRDRIWKIYLSGEIHTSWREQIKKGTEKLDLPIIYTSAVTDHESSDAAGDHLGKEENNFWRDHNIDLTKHHPPLPLQIVQRATQRLIQFFSY